MTDQKWQAAIALCEDVHGAGSGAKTIDALGSISKRLAEFSVSWIFGDLYQNETLSIKQRELLNIAGLVVLGDAGPQLANHVRAALRHGCGADEIKETILQMIIIAGFPRVVNSMLLANEVLQNHSLEK